MRVCLARLVRLLVLSLLVCLAPAKAANYHDPSPPGLADGGGIWANIWHYPAGDLDAYCSALRAKGVRNLFLQTSRSNTPAIAHPAELGQVIEACHRYKIRVIAWSFAELMDPAADAQKMIAAAKFRSPKGEGVDAIAPNMEKNISEAHITQYSKAIRAELGDSFPMLAVVYSPLNHCQEVAHIPWKVLARYYDVIAPMSYWNSKYQKLDAYDYTVGTVRTIRELTGRPDIEVHVIGDGMGTSQEAILQFMKGCKASEATSASIYPNHIMTPEQLSALSRYQDYFEPNSRFRLAAFRAMIRSGALVMPVDADPSGPIARADFLNLLSHHLRAPIPANTEMGERVPVYHEEAFALLAQMIDNRPAKGKQRRADRWFAQPAMAEPPMAPPINLHGRKPINYLDACLMVLEAGSAIR